MRLDFMALSSPSRHQNLICMKSFIIPLFLPLVLLTSLSLASLAEENIDLNTIKEGAKVSLEKYDKKSKTFSVIITDEPAVGPNYAHLKELLNSIGMTSEEFKKIAPQLKDKTFVLKKPLKLLSDKELEKYKLH